MVNRRGLLAGLALTAGGALAAHADVNGLDLTGVDDPELATALEREAAGTIKRVRRPSTADGYGDPALGPIRSFVETKTVWHPMGV